jgi:hypothetical protein
MLRLSLIALATSLFLHPGLVRAQESTHPGHAASPVRPPQTEGASGYDTAVPSDTPRGHRPRTPIVRGWRYAAAAALRARLEVAEREAARETRGREHAFRDHGLAGMLSGAAGIAGGLWTFLGSAFRGWGCSDLYSCGGSPDSVGIVVGSTFMGLGALAVITGGIVFCVRPTAVEPGEVTLTLGPGSIRLTF